MLYDLTFRILNYYVANRTSGIPVMKTKYFLIIHLIIPLLSGIRRN
jgi:hypothetical protein